MAISRGIKVAFGVILFLIVAGVIAAPIVAKAYVKDKIDTKLRDEFGELAHYRDMSISWSPLGAVVNDLTLGGPVPGGANQPTLTIKSVDVVLESAFNTDPHFKSLNIHGVTVTIAVDEKGESSFQRFRRELPLSPRKKPIVIDMLAIDDIAISTFVAPQTKAVQPQISVADVAVKPATSASSEVATSLIKVAGVHATGYIVPIPGQLLGHEQWISTVIDKVEVSGAAGKNDPQGPAPCVKIARIALELDQAETVNDPVRVRHFKVENSECLILTTATNSEPEFRRVMTSIQQGFGLQEPKEIHDSGKTVPKEKGAGLLIEDLTAANVVMETRADAPEKAAFYRLKEARIEAGNLAFGAQVKPPAPGYLKLESVTESRGVSGNLAISVTELAGSFPNLSFKCTYHIENVPGDVLSSMAKDSQQVTIRAGSLSMAFAGGANDGNLNIDGSVTLSKDFEVSGSSIKELGVNMTRGKPIDNVRIDGTLEHPQIHLPEDLALLADIMSNMLARGGPLGIVNATAGQLPVVGSVVKEATKEVGKGTKVLRQIPVFGELFKGDKKK